MTTSEDNLKTFCDDIENRGAERVVVRWTDESRPVDEDDGGITVREVKEATLKAGIDGEIVEETFEGLDYQTVKEVVEGYEFAALFRTDNVTGPPGRP